MRFRSLGFCGTNIRDYLSKIQEVETNFLHESIIAHLGTIELNNQVKIKEGHLGSNSVYKIRLLKRHRRKKKKMIKSYYYRKKFCVRQNKEKVDENSDSNSIRMK